MREDRVPAACACDYPPTRSLPGHLAISQSVPRTWLRACAFNSSLMPRFYAHLACTLQDKLKASAVEAKSIVKTERHVVAAFNAVSLTFA